MSSGTEAPGTTVATQSPTAIVHAHATEAGAVALTAQVEAQIKARTLVAINRPRNWLDVRSRLLAAFSRPILAEGAIYKKPVGNKHVEGLSIRFAEEAFRAMGNVDVLTTLVSDDDAPPAGKRVYVVSGVDLETNAVFSVTTVVTKTIERSNMPKDAKLLLETRTNSRGEPVYIIRALSEDDYRSKEQAALQKARRDVILFLTPGDIQEECAAQIRATLDDRDRKDPQGAVNRVADLYFAVGVSVAELEKFLGHEIKTMNNAELHVLRTFYMGIKEGEVTWADVMAEKLRTNTGADEGTSKGGTSKLAETLRAKQAEKASGTAAPVAEPKSGSSEPAAPPPTEPPPPPPAAPATPPDAKGHAGPKADPEPVMTDFVRKTLEKAKRGDRLTNREAIAVDQYRNDKKDWDDREAARQAASGTNGGAD